MWKVVKTKLKEKKYRIILILCFIFFISMYTLLDIFNGGYNNLLELYGYYLVVINILSNTMMSFFSAIMITISSVYFKLSGKEGKGTTLSGLSLLFGMFTYGCTPCIVSFFASIGITFSVMVLPLAGFPYKIISFIIVIMGYFWLRYEIDHAKCQR